MMYCMYQISASWQAQFSIDSQLHQSLICRLLHPCTIRLLESESSVSIMPPPGGRGWC